MLFPLIQLASGPNTWNENAIAISTIVIAIATIVYVIATIFLWQTTRQSVATMNMTFEASHRPYIGMSNIRKEVHSSPDRVLFKIEYKNVGNVPAHDFTSNRTVVIDGIILPMLVKEEVPRSIIFPNLLYHCIVTVDDPNEYKSVMNASTLSLVFKCTYRGVTEKEYSYEEKAAYNKETQTFTRQKGTAT